MAGTTHARDRNNPSTSKPKTITIWQQNVNRSHTCQHDLISSVALARRGIDIVALQEPAITNFGTTIASRDWIPVYPTTHSANPTKTRSIILIRNNILTENWKQVDFPSGDVTVVQLTGSWGDLMLYNIYNDCEKNDTINMLETFAHSPLGDHSNRSRENSKATLWLGDFNRHHLHWDDPADTRLFTRTAIDNAESLISAIAGLGLDLALPPGIPTHLHNVTKKWTRLDQVFILEEHLDTIITCDTLPNTPGINTNHLPILTTLDLNLTRVQPNPPRNFRDVNWEDFEKELAARLDRLGPQTRIRTPGELETACQKLTKVIQETINEKVPEPVAGIKAKKWWMKELTKLRQEANRAGRKASKYRDWLEHRSHKERKEAHKLFHKTLKHTKRQHWRDWLEEQMIQTSGQPTSTPRRRRGMVVSQGSPS